MNVGEEHDQVDTHSDGQKGGKSHQSSKHVNLEFGVIQDFRSHH